MIEDAVIVSPKKYRSIDQTPPISSELAELKKAVTAINKKMDNAGEALRAVHANTTPAVGWIPALAIGLIVNYPLFGFIEHTASDYKIAAWAAGIIHDARLATQDYALNLGVKSVGGETTFTSPLQRSLEVTSNFGYRTHPVTGKRRHHNGIDYRCKIGDSVHAVRSGRVTFAKKAGNAGNMIALSHSNGQSSIYMHLDKIRVKTGETVSTGELIGDCGATGRVTGPHLHLEIRNAEGTPLNPVSLVNIHENTDMWTFFKNTVAISESQGSGNYKAVSPSGLYRGRYQIGEAALTDAGYKHLSWNEFLNSPKLQDRIYRKWQRGNLRIARSGFSATKKERAIRGFLNDSTPAYKVAGFLHAAQFGGKNAVRWYSQGIDFKDGNGVAISEYARRGEVAFKSRYGLFASAKPLINAIEAGEL